MVKRICIDPGHGGDQPGAVFHGLKEKDVVLDVSQYAVEGLRILDPELWIGLTRRVDQTLTLQQRCDFANNMNVGCFVSVHCNADADPDLPGMPEARGEEIFYYDESASGLKLAQCLKGEIDKIFPNEPFRGIKSCRPSLDLPPGETRPYLYVLAKTRMPSVLVEIGFIDKSSSFETFTNPATLMRIGLWIAQGIHAYLEGVT